MSDFDPFLTLSIKTNLFLETQLKNDLVEFCGIMSLLINENYVTFTSKKLKLGVFLFVCLFSLLLLEANHIYENRESSF